MRYIVLTLLWVNFPLLLIAQSETDSLWNIWLDDTKEDSIRYISADKAIWRKYLRTNKDSAIYHAKKLYNFSKERLDPLSIAESAFTAAEMCRKAGRFNESYPYYRTANRYFVRGGNEKRMARTGLFLFGLSYQRAGMIDSALFIFNQQLKYGRENNDSLTIGLAYKNQGNAYQEGSMHEQAIMSFNNSILYLNQDKYQKTIIKVYSFWGMSLFEMGKYDEAYDIYERAMKVARQAGKTDEIASIYNNLGNLTWGIGDNPGALDFYRKSLAINKENKDSLQITINYVNIGGIHNYLENYDSAHYYLAESLKGFEHFNINQGVVEAYKKFGVLYYKKGEYELATEYCLKGLDLARNTSDRQRESFILEYLAKIELARGIEAKTAGDQNLKNKHYRKSISYSHQAIDLAQEMRTSFEERKALHFLSKAYLVCDSLDKAKTIMEQVLQNRKMDIENNLLVFSEREKERYFATMKDDYDLFYDYTLKNNKADPSLNGLSYNNALMIKGLLLKSSSAMKNAILSSSDTVLINMYNQWIALKRRITKLYANGGDAIELELEADGIEKELAKRSDEFRAVRKTGDLSWQDIQENLNDNEVAIEFLRFAHQEDYTDDESRSTLYCALILTKESDTPELVQLFKQEQLEKILGHFPGNNLSYIERLYGTRENPVNQLYNLVWKPLENYLIGAEKIYYAPVGLLHKVSFSALVNQDGVLIRDLYKLELKSSTGKITIPDNSHLSDNAVYNLFGGVEYNTEENDYQIWNYLEGSLEEVTTIQKVLKGKEVNSFVGKEATEEQFKKSSANVNVLHIATHGFFYPDPAKGIEIEEEQIEDEDLAFRGGGEGFGVESFVKNKNPLMRSGLALAGANDVWVQTHAEGEDGVLTAAEVAILDLRKTNLVVLSACETGLGDIKGSEGVYGLQRSFKMAGARYLIMSLWQVPDQETAEFMSIFYIRLNTSNDVKESFEYTQRIMSEKYDPYYWAAFVLVD